MIQNDTILYEKYFNGASRDTIVTSFSCAKQWDSALIGAAIDDGYIQSVDDPITDYLPELAERDPAFSEITIYDLLRMSSGIEYDGLGGLDGDDSKTYYYPDLRKLALEETTVVDSPGSGFLYNNYHPLLLGIILERATGMSVTDYLEARIWQPIGMEFDGSWSLDSEILVSKRWKAASMAGQLILPSSDGFFSIMGFGMEPRCFQPIGLPNRHARISIV